MKKKKIISKIQKIVLDYGSFSPNDAECDDPVIMVNGEQSVCVDLIGTDDVDASEYVGGTVVDEHTYSYDELKKSVLKDILAACENYKMIEDKMMDKTRDENI